MVKKVPITYEKYDEIWDICEKIKEESGREGVPIKKRFSEKTSFPTVQEMEAVRLSDNLDQYLPFILYYYLKPLDDMEEDPYYAESYHYIKELVDEKLDFIDDSVPFIDDEELGI